MLMENLDNMDIIIAIFSTFMGIAMHMFSKERPRSESGREQVLSLRHERLAFRAGK